ASDPVGPLPPPPLAAPPAGVTVMNVVRNSGRLFGARHSPETAWRPGRRNRGTSTVATAAPSAPTVGVATSRRSTPISAKVPGLHVRSVTVIDCPGAGVASSTVIERTGGGYDCAEAGDPARTSAAATTAATTTRFLMLSPCGAARAGAVPGTPASAGCPRGLSHRNPAAPGQQRPLGPPARSAAAQLGGALTESVRGRSRVVDQRTT